MPGNRLTTGLPFTHRTWRVDARSGRWGQDVFLLRGGLNRKAAGHCAGRGAFERDGRRIMAQLAEVGEHLLAAAIAAPYLERDEEHALALRWKNQADEKAMHRLARAHMRLVIALAVRFRHYGLSLADLIQEGHVGLLEAAARFEPDRDVRFSTYATWWIRASMQNYVLHNWSIVRGGTSSAQKALFFNLRRLRAKLAQGGDSPTGTEVFSQIAEVLGVSRSDVEVMDARLSGPDVSLNAPVGDSEFARRRGANGDARRR